MIYLASPYSHPDPAVEHNRYETACRVAAHFINRGVLMISPIVHSHILHTAYGCGGDWKTWEGIDRALIAAVDELWVLKLEGWEDSLGIEKEILFAEGMGIPVSYLEVPDEV